MANLLLPVGRMVAGSMYKPNDKDFEGKTLVVKSGPNVGKPRLDYFFAVAIKKGQERHWAETPWGQVIWVAGHTGFPNGEAQRPTFSWKVDDGDSTIPNRRNVIPNTKEGYAGHWVVKCSSGYPPRIYNANGTQQLLEPDAVKCGYFIQMAGTVDANGSVGNPGVYINHSMVALAGYGPEIVSGPDASAVGFGGQLPQGASPTPIGGTFNPAPPQSPSGAVPAYGATPPMHPAAGYAPPPAYPAPGAPSAAPGAGNYMMPPIPGQHR